jgi:hypothetical protein
LSVGILVVLTDGLLHWRFPDEYVEGKTPPDHLLAVSLATAFLYSVFGGWLTSRLAKADEGKHVWWLVAWGLAMGTASAAANWGKIQSWYQIGLILLWTPAVLLGGRLSVRRRKSAPA